MTSHDPSSNVQAPPLPTLQKLAEFNRPTALGAADVQSFSHQGAIIFAVSWGDLSSEDLLVRIQSPCLFGESFGVNSCDCGEQLRDAMALGKDAGSFLLVYLSNQEGRGHGMQTKIEAIDMEANEGLEMPEVFERKGLELDLRTYGAAAAVIKRVTGGQRIRLLTNNPKKVRELEAYGITVQREPLIVKNPTEECRRYLNSKRRKMDHLLPEFDV